MSRKCLFSGRRFFIYFVAHVLHRPKEVDLEGEFEPSLLNSGVYLIQLSMQVSTFAINYQVRYLLYHIKEVSKCLNGGS